jgi:hypothetical protein
LKYVALIFDIIESRNYKNRYEVQKFMVKSTEYLNVVYKSEIKKEVVVNSGDEFQGLFNNLQTAFLYIRKLQLLIYPVKIRCGIGYGEIMYDDEEWKSSGIEGEAYHSAREAINFVKKRKNNIIVFNTKSEYDRYLNVLCAASAGIKTGQSQMVRLIELIADVILPITPIVEIRKFYDYILENRIKLIKEENWNRVIGKFREIEEEKINLKHLFEMIKPVESKNSFKKMFCVEDYWLHGMSTNIAQVMNTTRQNIDRYVHSGKIKESRTIDKAIYEMLGEKIW